MASFHGPCGRSPVGITAKKLGRYLGFLYLFSSCITGYKRKVMNLFRARIKKLMSALGFPCCWVPKKYSAGKKKKKKSSNCWLKENSAPPFTCYSFTHIAGRVRITLVYRHRLVKMKAKVELPSRRWKGNSRGKHEVPEQQQRSDQL